MHAQPTPTGSPVGDTDTQGDTPASPARSSIAVGEAVGVIPASYDDILALHDAAGDDRATLEQADADHAHIISGDEMAPLWFCGQPLTACQRDRLPMADLAQLAWRTGLVRQQILGRRELRAAAWRAWGDRFGLPAAVPVTVTVEEYTAHAEITAGGLRFQYRAGDDPAGGHAQGRLELVEPCEACQDGLRRALIGPDDPWGDLGEALARPRTSSYAGPWGCWTCDEREAERAEYALSEDEPERPRGVGERIAEALESIADGLSAFHAGELPHSTQLEALHDLVDERLGDVEDRLDDLYGLLDEPSWLRRIWQWMTSRLRRSAGAGAGPGVYLIPDELAESVAAVRREMEARYAKVRAGKTPPTWTFRVDLPEQDRDGRDQDHNDEREQDSVEAVS